MTKAKSHDIGGVSEDLEIHLGNWHHGKGWLTKKPLKEIFPGNFCPKIGKMLNPVLQSGTN